MSRTTRVVVVTAIAMLLLGGLSMGRGLVRERQPVASTPTPAPLFNVAPLVLRDGQTACTSDIALTPRTQVAELLVNQDPADVPELSVTADGPGGYTSPPVRARITQGRTLTARLEAPQRALFGRLCVRNEGPGTARLVGTNEFQTRSRARSSIDGEPVEADLTLTLYEDRRTSVLGDLPAIVERMAVLRGFLGHTWLIWPLLVLVAVGTPLAVLRVLALALRDDEDVPTDEGRAGPSLG